MLITYQKRLHELFGILIPLLKNTSWLMLEKFFRAVLALIVGAWVARYLGPADFGKLAFVLAFTAFVQCISYLALDGIVVRDIVESKIPSGGLIGTTIALRLLVGLVCWITSVLAVAIIYGFDNQLVVITALVTSTIVFQCADTIDLWFQSQTQSFRTVFAKLVAHLVANGVKVWLILSKATLVTFASVYALDTVLTSIGLVLAYQKFKSPSPITVSVDLARSLLAECWPYVLSAIAVATYMRIDQFLINYYLGVSKLGIYSVALPFSQVWYVIPMTIGVSLAPFITRKKIEGQQQYYRSLVLVFRLYALISLVISVLVSSCSYIIIKIVYGHQYYEAASVLAIHVFTNFFVFQNLAQGLWSINEKRGLLNTYQALVGAISACVSGFILIPYFGLVGAAISANVAFAMSGVFSNLLFAPEIFQMQFGFMPKKFR
jgi:O-antigen/teichoic acid export membrane protein